MSRLLQDGMASGMKVTRTDSQKKPAIICDRMHNDRMSWGGYVMQNSQCCSRGLMSKCAPQVAVFVHSG